MANRRELEAMLSESVADCRKREAEAYHAATEGMSDAPVVLMGAGGLGRLIARIARENGGEVLAFCDNAERLWGNCVEGVPVLSPAAAAVQFGSSAVFIVTIWAAFAPGTMPERIRQLRDLGCRCVVPFQFYLWKYPSHLPYFNVDLPSRLLEQRDAVWSCMDLWADERSGAEYAGQVLARLATRFDGVAPRDPGREYFPSDLVSFSGEDVFVDAGAFDGDSLESFIEAASGKFRYAVAYEPDPENYRKLRARVEGPLAVHQSRLSARRQAVSDVAGVVSFLADQGMSSRPGAEGLEVEAVALDSLLEEGIVPTYMKFDVEGFEPWALKGAAGTITRYSPTLAVCVYHKQDHLWTLPLAVHDLNPNYRYHLRPYGFIWDEVCYAIPDGSKPGDVLHRRQSIC
jgi:FkbM family methyltransferase